MAIEFNCPYCTAPIRVPDTYSGKKGSCPKCATKLLVPDVGPQAAPPQAAPPQVAPPQAAPPQAAPPQAAPPQAAPPQAAPPQAAPAQAAPHQVGAFNFGEEATPTEPPPKFAEPPPTTNVSKRLKKKQRRGKSQQMFTMGIPLVLFAIFLTVIGILTLAEKPDLTGELAGATFAVQDIPIATVAASECGLRGAAVTKVIDGFSSAPETLSGTWNRCVISAEKKSLTVTVRAVSGAGWFTVNPQENAVLSKWIRDHRVETNRQRIKLISETGTELCAMKLERLNGASPRIPATRIRDNFALAAHVQSFGFAVEAVVGSRATMCAHEDVKGTLYFALPEDTTEFTLRGRSLEQGGPRLFPGEYIVKLTTSSAEDSETGDETKAETTKPDDTELPSSKEEPEMEADGEMTGGGAMMNAN